MRFQAITIFSLAALTAALPTIHKRAVLFADTTYNAISISGGKAGNAEAEARALFSKVNMNDLANLDKSDVSFLNNVNQVANDAEDEGFNPAIAAASGDAATALQD